MTKGAVAQAKKQRGTTKSSLVYRARQKTKPFRLYCTLLPSPLQNLIKNLIGSQLITAMRHFQLSVSIPLAWSRTLICFIPKSPNPNTVTQFRPISLYTTLYRILSKTLVNRLAPLMSSIIGPEQSAFLRGRSIADNVMLIQEIAHSISRYKRNKTSYSPQPRPLSTGILS